MAQPSSKSSNSPSERKTGDAPPTFEQSLEALEAIVRRLEEGDLPLAEALSEYESGVKHLRQCHQLLQQAQRKIELLCGVDEQGNPITEPLDDPADDSTEGNLESKADSRSKRRLRPRRTESTPPRKGVRERKQGNVSPDPSPGEAKSPPRSEIDRAGEEEDDSRLF